MMQRLRLLLILIATLLLAGTETRLGEAPAAEASFPGVNGRIAIVTNVSGEPRIATINADGSDLRILTQSTAGVSYPRVSSDVSGEPRIATINADDSDLRILTQNTDRPLGPAGGGNIGGVSYPRVSPDGKRIVYGGIEVNHYDVFSMNADGSDLKNLTNSPAREALPSWSPDGQRIAFVTVNEEGNDLWLMNADGANPTRLTSGQNWSDSPTSWSPDGTEIMLAGRSGGDLDDIYSVNAQTGAITNLTNTTGSSDYWFADWSPDGQKIVFSRGPEFTQFDIWVMNRDGTGPHPIVTLPGGQTNPDWSPDGTKIVFLDANSPGSLRIVNADGSGTVTTLPNIAGGAYFPDWGPAPPPPIVGSVEFTQGIQELQTLSELQASLGGGSSVSDETPQAFPGANGKLVFSQCATGMACQIVVVNSDGSAAEPLASGTFPSWSPDGQKIAFRADSGISVMNQDGSEQTSLGAFGYGPGWSPDGSRIAFTGAGGVSVINADGTGLHTVTSLATIAASLARWSPDGEWILFTSNTDVDLYKIHPDGTGLTNITHKPSPSFEVWGDWSPDGTKIVYAEGIANTADPDDIYTINADGSGRQFIADGGIFPAWAPDGTKIAFKSATGDGSTQAFVVNADGSGVTPIPDTAGVGSAGIDWQPLPVLQVEFTQAIQQLQTLSELQTDLAGDGQPPVPIVAGKPLAMRVYFEKVQETTNYTAEVSGEVNQADDVTIGPGCTATDRRRQEDGCTSLDYYFTPPEGDWSVRLVVSDVADGSVVLDEEFNLTSIKTKPLTLVPVQVCDTEAGGVWFCTLPSDIAQLLPFFRKTFPGEVNVVSRGDSTKRSPPDDDAWWSAMLDDVLSFWAAAGSPQYEYYYGLVRANAGGDDSPGGMAFTPGHAGASRMSAMRTDLHGGTRETADEVVAHELGHNFGRDHAPSPGTAGCYFQPEGLDPAWPYPNDPKIQEVGFDVATGTAKVETEFTDWEGYCTPRWITPYTYNAVMDVFEVASASVAVASVAGPFWLVDGTIDGNAAELKPIFQLETTGPTDEGAGSYRIEVRGAGDAVLFTRRFEPSHAHTEFQDLGDRFLESVPLQAGAASIVILDPGDVELATIALTGATPVVDITLPGSFAGNQTIEWTIADADGGAHTSWVQYSTDGGATWQSLAMGLSKPSLQLDFDGLAGSADARLRVLVSDGVNTGVAESAPFSVGEKAPTAEIVAPEGGTFRSGQLVWLQGSAFDLDDGFLEGGSVTWTSSRDGSLGTGAALPVYGLSAGLHTITMTARDSNNNTATDSVTLTVFDGPIVEAGAIADIDCSGTVDGADALALLYHIAGLDAGSCKTIGSGTPIAFGDADCDGIVGPGDVVAVLALVADLPRGCT